MTDNKIVVFDFTGVLYRDETSGMISETLTVGYQYDPAIEDVVIQAEVILGWQRDRDLRPIHFGNQALFEAFVNSRSRWRTDWSGVAATLHRFQLVLAELGVRSVKAYETAQWPPLFSCLHAPETNPLALEPVNVNEKD